MKYLCILSFIFLILNTGCDRATRSLSIPVVDKHGAIVRIDTTQSVIYLVFTAHEFAEGYPIVHETLSRHGIKASFFFTGDFYRTPVFKGLIDTLKMEGHYLGAHSDKHLLYCTWEDRDSLLITKNEFVKDVEDNYYEMARFGIETTDALYFMPPYEWYNLQISKWTDEMGLKLFNFTGGTSSNQDWTYPDLGKSYFSSDSIFNRIIRYEEKYGMKGFILLSHIGTDPRRTDKFYYKLNDLIEILLDKGYTFNRIE